MILLHTHSRGLTRPCRNLIFKKDYFTKKNYKTQSKMLQAPLRCGRNTVVSSITNNAVWQRLKKEQKAVIIQSEKQSDAI